MLLDNMKGLIKYTIELDIDCLEIFLGYEGVKVCILPPEVKMWCLL